MSTATFRDLVAAFPPAPEDKFRAAKLSTGLSYVKVASSTFVEPTFEIDSPIEAGRTSVVLISAPGAVGKSTLASELAFRTGALLWDLSRFQVGSKTFSGTVFDAYGNMTTGVQKRFAEGGFLFVLDALDEAQIRAGSQNFDAFLEDLASALKEPRSRPTLAVLARTDTADWIYAVLEEAGVPIARYQIEYFDRARAFEFIEKQLDDRRRRDGRQSLHRTQVSAYAEARAALFALIYKLFGTTEGGAWTDQRVRDFLGYAPVLEALTDYLDVPNYMAFTREVQAEPTDGRDPWQFLTDVLTHLLAREQTKIINAVRGNLEAPAKAAGWSDWERLYGADEQLSRVLAYSMRTSPQVTTGLPASMDAPYETAIKTSMPQHPFLSGTRFANVVFREFAYAWALTHGSSKMADSLREAMRHREEPFLPSQLFSRFVARPGDEEQAVLDGQDFGLVYESLLARAQKVLLSVSQVGDAFHASVGLGAGAESSLEMQLLDSGSGVHFWRRLGNADIDIDAPVRLGLPEQRFTLGPSVDLTCSQLTVACDDMDIDLVEGVILRAQTYTSGSASLRLRLRNEESGKLAIIWPGAAHPWAVYRSTDAAGILQLGDTDRGDALRKLILMFRRQKSRKADTLLGARWATGQLEERDRLIELATRRKVIERVGGGWFEWNTDFNSLVSLLTGKRDALSAAARSFAAEYLGDDAERVLGGDRP
jgi:hypothetical protein